jgi:hypothetical protein
VPADGAIPADLQGGSSGTARTASPRTSTGSDERTATVRAPASDDARGASPRAVVWGSAITMGVVGAGLYGYSIEERIRFDRDPSEAGAKSVNRAFLAALGTGVGAAGLATFAIAGKF